MVPGYEYWLGSRQTNPLTTWIFITQKPDAGLDGGSISDIIGLFYYNCTSFFCNDPVFSVE
jgi:hypothetical protein